MYSSVGRRITQFNAFRPPLSNMYKHFQDQSHLLLVVANFVEMESDEFENGGSSEQLGQALDQTIKR